MASRSDDHYHPWVGTPKNSRRRVLEASISLANNDQWHSGERIIGKLRRTSAPSGRWSKIGFHAAPPHVPFTHRLQDFAAFYIGLQDFTAFYINLQHLTAIYIDLQHFTAFYIDLQHFTSIYSVLQHFPQILVFCFNPFHPSPQSARYVYCRDNRQAVIGLIRPWPLDLCIPPDTCWVPYSVPVCRTYA